MHDLPKIVCKKYLITKLVNFFINTLGVRLFFYREILAEILANPKNVLKVTGFEGFEHHRVQF
jgi:hypothetical protein